MVNLNASLPWHGSEKHQKSKLSCRKLYLCLSIRISQIITSNITCKAYKIEIFCGQRDTKCFASVKSLRQNLIASQALPWVGVVMSQNMPAWQYWLHMNHMIGCWIANAYVELTKNSLEESLKPDFLKLVFPYLDVITIVAMFTIVANQPQLS